MLFKNNVYLYIFNFFFNYGNFFFINSFNSIFFFLSLKNNKPVFFLIKQNSSILNNNKLDSLTKNIFFLKFYKLFLISDINNINNESYNFLNYKNKNIFIFDYKFYKFYKFFTNFIFNLFSLNFNLLILDSSYKHNFFFYSNLFQLKDIINFKSFFFPKPIFFTKKNWIFFFNVFCKSFNISVFFINDFLYFFNYLEELSELNMPTISVIPLNKTPLLIDYYIFFKNYNYNFIKFISLFFINNIFTINLNFKYINYRLKYLLIFYNFFKNLS